jgi:DNA polymerase-3 subunit delta
MNNVYLFHGENSHSSKEKLQTWIDKLASKSDINFDLSDIDCSSAPWDKINESLMLLPLFGDKRLIILRFPFSRGSKEVQKKLVEKLNFISDKVILVIYEDVTIGDKSVLAPALKSLKSYHYPALNGVNFINLIEDILSKDNKKMDKPTILYLSTLIGSDTVRLTVELKKLINASNAEIISRDEVERNVVGYENTHIYELSDAILTKKSAIAAKLMLTEMEFGTHPLQITALLINQIRKMIILKECIDLGKSEQETVKLLAMHPYALSKLRNSIRQINRVELILYFKKLVIADALLKQGYQPEPVMLNLVR